MQEESFFDELQKFMDKAPPVPEFVWFDLVEYGVSATLNLDNGQTVRIGPFSEEVYKARFPIQIGEIINIKGEKRKKLQVTAIGIPTTGEQTFTSTLFYKPSPRSQIRKKNHFSKVLMPLL